MSIEAMKAALEVLEGIGLKTEKMVDAIALLRQALDEERFSQDWQETVARAEAKLKENEMTDLRKAAEQALEALEMFCEHGAILRPLETKETLRLALAQPDEVLAEREACAKLCENIERNGAWITKTEAAKAIRSRGVDLAMVGEVGVWGEEKNT